VADRRKIAVLGGGMAGLTTALMLTSTEELRERYEVTLYQMGWRLGGKCATGRDRSRGDRIEEHGLHLWYGGYDNAFSVLGTCYEELARPAGTRFRTIDEAFVPMSFGVLYDHYDHHWSHAVNALPRNLDRPGRRPTAPLIFDLIEDALDGVWLEFRALLGDPVPRDPTSRPGPSRLPGVIARPLSRAARAAFWLGDVVESGVLDVTREVIRHARGSGARTPLHHSLIARLLRTFRDGLWRLHAEARQDDDDARHSFSRIDAIVTTVIGVLEDRLIQRGVDAVNDEEFTAWLRRHGAKEPTLTSGFVRQYYSAVFATCLGPTVIDSASGAPWHGEEHEGALAAGTTAIIALGSTFVYRGTVLWKPLAGFADVVVTPMYETLRRRGVRVELFARVDHLELSHGEPRLVERIKWTRQAKTKHDRPYEPTFDVQGVAAWPNEPDWDQLANGDRLRKSGVDFEAGELDEDHCKTELLERGVDFHDAVLAIHVAALPSICSELMSDASNPRFREMIEGTRTVQTQAVQLWSTRSVDELGWPYGGAVASSYVEPLDTYCDMSAQLPSESWGPADGVRSVAYYCGALPEVPEESAEGSLARVRQGAIDYLSGPALRQWPGAIGADGFDWSVLHDPGGAVGPERLDAQFLRANTVATERYVQTPPGFHRSRLRADESGYENLFLAGDWVRNGVDVGAVEAAVTAAMWAARAICGSPERIGWEELLI
jgi:uncharacterized protein with NAD-binding domain and iron-sulfur cluster